MSSLLMYFMQLLCFAPSITITWGTTDHEIQFMQHYYGWIKIANIGDEAVDINSNISHVDFFVIGKNSDTTFMGRSLLRSSRPFILRPNNSFYQYFGFETGRIFGDIVSPESARILARSFAGVTVYDSIVQVTINPIYNRKLVKWFFDFDSMRTSSFYDFPQDKKSNICKTADSLLHAVRIPSDKNENLNIASSNEFIKYCENKYSICGGIPNSGWAYIKSLSKCARNKCNDVVNNNCLEANELQDKLTNSILNIKMNLKTDVEGYHRLLSSSDTVYIPALFFHNAVR